MEPVLPPAIDAYARAHSTPPSALVAELEAYTRAHFGREADMLIGPTEGALLRLLVRLAGARKVLEIGLFTGYSALTMAEALPADGSLISCEINPESAAVAQSFFARSEHGRKISIRLGPALETLATLREQTFDLVFLDADKENYPRYYEEILPLLRPGGLLVADNVLWSGRVLAPERASDHALVRFNELVTQDTRVDSVLLTVRDGVMVARKKD